MKRERDNDDQSTQDPNDVNFIARDVDTWLELAKNHAAIGNNEEAYRVYFHNVANRYWDIAVEQKIAADQAMAEIGVELGDFAHQDVLVRRQQNLLHRAVDTVRFLEASAINAVRNNTVDYAAFAGAIEQLPSLGEVREARQGVDTFARFELMREDHAELQYHWDDETTGAEG